MNELVLCIGVMLLGVTVAVCGQEKVKTDVEKFTDLAKVENVKRFETDAKGVVRVWIEIDKDHAIIAKFKDIPIETDIKAVRDKTLAQEAEAKAMVAAETAKTTQAETWKAEGKCPTCGQVLPKEVVK